MFLILNAVLGGTAWFLWSPEAGSFRLFLEGLLLITATNGLYLTGLGILVGLRRDGSDPDLQRQADHRKTRGFLDAGITFPALMLHLVLNLAVVLVFYLRGGMGSRPVALTWAGCLMVHLVFVNWVLLSILRPLSGGSHNPR